MKKPSGSLPLAPSLSGYFPAWARDLYIGEGWEIVEPGSPLGVELAFTSHDWRPDSFLALADRQNEIEAPLLVARHPGQGAFTRLVERLYRDGYRFGVVSPMAGFAAHLARCGWYRERHSTRGDIWRRPD